jgi:hypothetical protein
MKCKFYDASWTGFVICNYYERIMRYVKMAVLHFTITRGNFGERVTLACAVCTDLQYVTHGYTATPELWYYDRVGMTFFRCNKPAKYVRGFAKHVCF